MSEECLTDGKALEIKNIQSVIDGRIAHLDGLRKLPASDLTLHEMKKLEGRLYQLFGRQLAIKDRLDADLLCEEHKRYPNFKQWLHVVDIHLEALEMLSDKLQTLNSLLDMGESETRTIMTNCGCKEEEIKRLLSALKNLKKVYRTQYPGGGVQSKELPTEDCRDVGGGGGSESNSPSESSSPDQKRPSIDSLNSDISESQSVPITPPPYDHPTFDIPPMSTPPLTPTSKRVGKSKGTPPPIKKLNLPLTDGQQPIWSSKSTESVLPHSRPGFDSIISNLKPGQMRRGGHDLPMRRYSDDHTDAVRANHSPSRKISPGSVGMLPDSDLTQKFNKTTLTVPPRSPRTLPRTNMLHAIKHRFSKKKVIRLQNCHYCQEKIVLQGYRCKDCKYVCHSGCKFQAEKLPSCGLPRGFEEAFRSKIEAGSVMHSPILNHKQVNIDNSLGRSHEAPPAVPSSTGDSSSNPSSTTSSTPSSPAPFATPSSSSITPPSPAQPSPRISSSVPQFKFPDITPDDFLDGIDNNDNVHSISSDRTITVDSHDNHDPFTDSERTLPEQVEPVDYTSDPEPVVTTRKNSQKLLSEWDIPYEELVILDLIGNGRFGPVHKGKWHGDVAIKMIDIDFNDEKQLQAFKGEVSIFRKTRHDYVVLFMGACMRPPHLAIVTSLCKGQTLYTHIHLRKDRFNMNRTIQIATQIAQGMGYLHAKGIIHKDLKSKNIFIENGKVVITDFALFSIGRLSKQKIRKDTLLIPDGWLCYLAPELITSLRINMDGNTDMELPFSDKSDIYAFGTVWYELLAGEWPFHKQPVESVIWQVGKGLKQPLCHLQASRDVKEILMMCWAYTPESRPTFPQIKKTIIRLPKKKGLHRSPSHPLHLSRSAESVL